MSTSPTVRLWGQIGALVGAAIGALWGLLIHVYFDAPLVVVFSLLGALPGLIGGLFMSQVAPWVLTVGGRLVAATFIGAALGLVYGLTPLMPGYYFYTIPSGAVGGLITAAVVSHTKVNTTDLS